MGLKFIVEKVRIDLVCSFTDFSFIMGVYGRNDFWARGGFFAAIQRVATGQTHHIQALNYTLMVLTQRHHGGLCFDLDIVAS